MEPGPGPGSRPGSHQIASWWPLKIFLFFYGIFDPWHPGGALEARILAENGSEMPGNSARKASKRSVQAVSSASVSMSPWGLLGDPFETGFVVKCGPYLGPKPVTNIVCTLKVPPRFLALDLDASGGIHPLLILAKDISSGVVRINQ